MIIRSEEVLVVHLNEPESLALIESWGEIDGAEPGEIDGAEPGETAAAGDGEILVAVVGELTVTSEFDVQSY
jgi:hypothetical protein